MGLWRKLDFHAKEAGTLTLGSSEPGNLQPDEEQPVPPSASRPPQRVSAGAFHRRDVPVNPGRPSRGHLCVFSFPLLVSDRC